MRAPYIYETRVQSQGEGFKKSTNEVFGATVLYVRETDAADPSLRPKEWKPAEWTLMMVTSADKYHDTPYAVSALRVLMRVLRGRAELLENVGDGHGQVPEEDMAIPKELVAQTEAGFTRVIFAGDNSGTQFNDSLYLAWVHDIPLPPPARSSLVAPRSSACWQSLALTHRQQCAAWRRAASWSAASCTRGTATSTLTACLPSSATP